MEKGGNRKVFPPFSYLSVVITCFNPRICEGAEIASPDKSENYTKVESKKPSQFHLDRFADQAQHSFMIIPVTFLRLTRLYA